MPVNRSRPRASSRRSPGRSTLASLITAPSSGPAESTCGSRWTALGISVDRRRTGVAIHRWLGDLRASCRTRLTAQLDDRTAPLASALILGQRDEIDPEINDAFARTGTTHLLAISGLQLQALAVSLIYLFRLLNVPRRLAYARGRGGHYRLCRARRTGPVGRSLGRHDADVLPGRDRPAGQPGRPTPWRWRAL